jgi:hypothetical protein
MANPDITKIPAPRTPFLDQESGDITPAWYRFLYNLFTTTGSGTGNGISTANGGTGQTSYTDGQLLIGNSTNNSLNKNTLSHGTGIGIINGHGSIQINNDGVTSVAANTGISVSGSTGGVTISNSGVTSIIAGTGITVSGSTGAVTINSVNNGVTTFSGGSTGLTPNTPTNGAVVLGGTLAIANGGTNATTASDARTNLGLGNGLSVVITTAKLTTSGANGSMTFTNGILTAQTQAT